MTTYIYDIDYDVMQETNLLRCIQYAQNASQARRAGAVDAALRQAVTLAARERAAQSDTEAYISSLTSHITQLTAERDAYAAMTPWGFARWLWRIMSGRAPRSPSRRGRSNV